MRTRTAAVAALFGLVLHVGLPAAAHAQEPGPTPVPHLSPNSPRVTPWEASLAYRGSWFESPGYAPFAATDRFAQVTLGASRAVLSRRRFSLAVGAAWDYGNTGASARGSATSLEVHRVTVPVTLRFALMRWVDLFARVAPGAALASAVVNEPSGPAPLAASRGCSRPTPRRACPGRSRSGRSPTTSSSRASRARAATGGRRTCRCRWRRRSEAAIRG